MPTSPRDAGPSRAREPPLRWFAPPTMLLNGSITATVIAVDRVSIHGDVYLDMVIQSDEQRGHDQVSRLRVPMHVAGEQDIAPGARVRIEFLLNQPTKLTVLG